MPLGLPFFIINRNYRVHVRMAVCQYLYLYMIKLEKNNFKRLET